MTADSDSRTWYGFADVMTYPDRTVVNVAGWVVGLVLCAAVAGILLVELEAELVVELLLRR